MEGSFRKRPRKQHVKSAKEIAELDRLFEAKQEARYWKQEQAQRAKEAAKNRHARQQAGAQRKATKAQRAHALENARAASKAKNAASKANLHQAAGNREPVKALAKEVCVLAYL